MWWLWTLTLAGAADCGDPSELAASALDAVVEARVEVARSALDGTVDAWACSGAATPEDLGRYWLSDGALLVFAGQEAEAEESFAAARRSAPDLWDPRLGAPLQASWSSAPLPEGTGTVAIQPALPAALVVDGVLQEGTVVATSPGIHLVQVLATDERARFARLIHVSDGQAVVVRTGLTPADVAPPAPAPQPPVDPTPAPLPEAPPPTTPTAQPPVWLMSAVAVGAVSVGAAIGARGQRSAIENASSVTALDAAVKRQKTLASVAYAGGGVAAGFLVVHLVR